MTKILAQYPTGSKYICFPPVENTDEDWVVLVEEGYEQELSDKGFVYSMSDVEYSNPGIFISARKGNLNWIVTTNKAFFKRFVLATKVARKLNLLEKQSRVALFQAILYGK